MCACFLSCELFTAEMIHGLLLICSLEYWLFHFTLVLVARTNFQLTIVLSYFCMPMMVLLTSILLRCTSSLCSFVIFMYLILQVCHLWAISFSFSRYFILFVTLTYLHLNVKIKQPWWKWFPHIGWDSNPKRCGV